MYRGFDPKSKENPANVVGWSTTAADDGFVPPSNYSTPDIVCHRAGAPAEAHMPVKPGDKIHIQWNGWPQSHKGPVLSYLAPCGSTGCAGVDKTNLKFFKIDNSAPTFLNDTGGPPGFWATDVLIASNNSWVLEIPPVLAPGPYVLRHEIIALHYAARPDGAQNYPQCFNVWVAGDGVSAAGSTVGQGQGGVATGFYKPSDPGISIDIYRTISTYAIPGPTMVSGAAPVPMASQHVGQLAGPGTPVLVQETTTVPFPSETKTAHSTPKTTRTI
ncbi:Glycosylhydrolase family 61-11 [Pleurostoma richardsiae]|uniref:lytic cellulose monooxygenase (C4-dehydrogenating) n=1 Tax=Pleurostoma richardsiae TaxID=41990 RepID=A0AA38R4G9_9PEZI|nr:Glycosylhydrolase family 61-11 [Pleurostoma richardsiae]